MADQKNNLGSLSGKIKDFASQNSTQVKQEAGKAAQAAGNTLQSTLKAKLNGGTAAASTTASKPTATVAAAVKPTAAASSVKPTAAAAPSVKPTTAKKSVFSDVAPDAVYADAVAWAVEKGITTGTGPTTFAPDNPCHRGHVATFLWRAKGSPAPKSAKSPFTDVQDGPFVQAVLWAVESGIMEGKTATTFGVKDPCTRGEALMYLLRTQGKPKATQAEANTWAAQNRLLAGQTGGGASHPCTRSDIVTYLYRAIGK